MRLRDIFHYGHPNRLCDTHEGGDIGHDAAHVHSQHCLGIFVHVQGARSDAAGVDVDVDEHRNQASSEYRRRTGHPCERWNGY